MIPPWEWTSDIQTLEITSVCKINTFVHIEVDADFWHLSCPSCRLWIKKIAINPIYIWSESHAAQLSEPHSLAQNSLETDQTQNSKK